MGRYMLSRRYKRNQSYVLAGALLTSAAWYVSPANADASLDELKARVEKAQKENLLLKAEKLERENLTMKAEALEAENATLRKEAKVDKTPVASIPVQRTAYAPSTLQEAKTVTKSEATVASASTSKEHVSPSNEINRALDNIPQDDARREIMAAYKAPKEEVPVAVKIWQGIYAGINGGYGYGSQFTTTNGYGTKSNNSYPSKPEASIIYGNATGAYNGGFAGGQIGYNHQFTNDLVVGGELDLDWADVNTNNAGGNGNSSTYQLGESNSLILTTSGRTGLDWIGTVRLRIGYALGNFLPYATVGAAYGGMSSNSLALNGTSYNYYQSPTNYYNSWSGYGFTAKGSTVNVGWAAGAGFEYMVASNWSLKSEYLYTQISGYNTHGVTLNPQSQTGVGGYYNFASAPTMYNTNHLSPFGVHQVRVGLNYHTDWLASKPAVTAKY
jgi:outer membrane immunogenic protein